jgi:hypothetical protein
LVQQVPVGFVTNFSLFSCQGTTSNRATFLPKVRWFFRSLWLCDRALCRQA